MMVPIAVNEYPSRNARLSAVRSFTVLLIYLFFLFLPRNMRESSNLKTLKPLTIPFNVSDKFYLSMTYIYLFIYIFIYLYMFIYYILLNYCAVPFWEGDSLFSCKIISPRSITRDHGCRPSNYL